MTYINIMGKPILKALQTIQMLVEECREKKTTRMPTTIEMARSAGVSPSTIRKALKVLSRQGIIKVAPKTGVTVNLNVPYIPSIPSSHQIEPASGPKWQYLMKKIEQEIIPRLSNTSPLLPSVKELSYRFGAAHKTLQKALNELAKVGRLEKYKRGYKLHSQFTLSGKKKIFVVSPLNLEADFLKVPPVLYDIRHTLEMICAQNNFLLDFLPFNNDGVIDSHLFATKYNHPEEILGYIVFGLADEQYPFYQLLYSTGKPVAILDSDTPNLKLPFLGFSKFRIFQIGMSSYCGSKCAFYLKDRGHKHIAYLSIWHDSSWSQIRLEGIVNIFDQLGPEYSVTPFCTSPQIFLKNQQPQDTFIAHVETVEPVRIGYVSNRSVISAPVEDLCRKALEHKEITAWIATNDFVALDCMDFLKKCDIAVPEKISIIGFDDCFEAISYNLTSFNFDGQALIHSMVNYILTSQRSDHFQKQSEVEVVDGYIIERKTVISVR
jgi:DNA-binding LacI/PurR family transcriptional regulator/DNA-binding transcriptional regulator YhcF (GntR family)